MCGNLGQNKQLTNQLNKSVIFYNAFTAKGTICVSASRQILVCQLLQKQKKIISKILLNRSTKLDIGMRTIFPS